MIPFHTTRVDVLKPEVARDSQDPYDDTPAPGPTVIASNVRAVIVENGGGPVGPGDNELAQLKMRCDPCTIDHRCSVKDLSTGRVYEVVSAFEYGMPPLEHIKVRLKRTDLGGGESNA